MQIGRSPVLSQRCTHQDQAGKDPFGSRHRGRVLARTDGTGQSVEETLCPGLRDHDTPNILLPRQSPPRQHRSHAPWEEVGRDPVPILHPPPWPGMLVATATRCKQQEEPTWVQLDLRPLGNVQHFPDSGQFT